LIRVCSFEPLRESPCLRVIYSHTLGDTLPTPHLPIYSTCIGNYLWTARASNPTTNLAKVHRQPRNMAAHKTRNPGFLGPGLLSIFESLSLSQVQYSISADISIRKFHCYIPGHFFHITNVHKFFQMSSTDGNYLAAVMYWAKSLFCCAPCSVPNTF
jgi:hypothetical protein